MPGRDLAQRLPDALLEGGAAHVERQVEAERRRLDEAHDLGDQLLEIGIAADQLRAREAVLEIAHKRVRIVAQQDGADALVALRHQDRAERALADGEADLGVRAAGAVAASASCRASRRTPRRSGRSS